MPHRRNVTSRSGLATWHRCAAHEKPSAGWAQPSLAARCGRSGCRCDTCRTKLTVLEGARIAWDPAGGAEPAKKRAQGVHQPCLSARLACSDLAKARTAHAVRSRQPRSTPMATPLRRAVGDESTIKETTCRRQPARSS